MLSKITFATVALQASLVLAGKAVVANRCPYDIWVWSISTGHPSTSFMIPARSTHSEEYTGSSTSLKISKSEALVAGQHTQFEYSIAAGQLWYDISFVDCAKGESASSCPGHDEGLAMDASDDSCGKIDCPAGEYCPTQAYYVDTPLQKLGIAEPVFMCPKSLGTGVDLYMKVCSGQEQIKRSVAGRMAINGET
jgi:hypothetical protein